MNQPKIAIIMPLYNVAEWLPRAVDSVLQQTYQNLEIILVDDGSTDASAQICDNYAQQDPRVRVFHNPNEGVAAARNFGIGKVTADYLCFVDADDVAAPEYVTTLYQALSTHDAAIAVGGINKIKLNQHCETHVPTKLQVVDPKTMYQEFLRDEYLALYAKLYRTSLFKNIVFPVGQIYEDVAVDYQLFAQCMRIVLVPTVVYTYYKRRDSVTTESFNIRSWDLITEITKMCIAIKTAYPEYSDFCDSRIMWSYIIVLWKFLMLKKPDQAIRNQLMQYIKTHRRQVLRQKKLPRRIRLTLWATYFGFGFLRFARKLYLYLSGEYKGLHKK